MLRHTAALGRLQSGEVKGQMRKRNTKFVLVSCEVVRQEHNAPVPWSFHFFSFFYDA